MMDWNNGLGWHNNMGWGGWFGMGIFMILFWGLIIWGIVSLVRSMNASGQKASFHARAHEAATSPDQILGERFARSEIDEEEYSRRLAVLRSPNREK